MEFDKLLCSFPHVHVGGKHCEIDDATMQRIENEIGGLKGLDNQMKNELGGST